jgi:hypothetical protein
MDERDALHKSDGTFLCIITESTTRPRLLAALLITPVLVFLSATVLYEWRWPRSCSTAQDELHNNKSKSTPGTYPLDPILRRLTSGTDSIFDTAQRTIEFTALKFVPNKFSAVAGEDGSVEAAWASIGTNSAFLVHRDRFIT